jgi:hypothetical protein
MSAGLPSCRTISYTRARSARDRRSNTRPGADQLRCNGSSTTARARITSSRGSRSGTHTGLPRAEGSWVNETCGCAASSHPAPERSRAKVATVGDFRPCSYADSVGREVPARRASSSWVRPELTRTCSSSSAALIMHLVYPIRYRIRSDTDAGWRPVAQSSFRAPGRDAHNSAPGSPPAPSPPGSPPPPTTSCSPPRATPPPASPPAVPRELQKASFAN